MQEANEFFGGIDDPKIQKKHYLYCEIENPKKLKKIITDQNIKENISLPNLELKPNLLNDKNQIIQEQIKSECECKEGCLHEVIMPSSYINVPHPPPPATPYRQYPFKLDPFQIQAIKVIERNESVLVSAHTSAGKTVVAEYAIAVALKHNQRVIYTSPIKALSNQKYRELLEEFHDVGLMTGDVTINPSSSCIVMTTEILRSMLYKGSEITREISWVIFDEIHYMRDKERGVIWEETIILLPSIVKLVFLSATIKNAREFAEWIVKLKNKPCNVIYTDFRPVPLTHYIYPIFTNEIFQIVDQSGSFNEDQFNQGFLKLNDEIDIGINKNDKKRETVNISISRLLSIIKEKEFLPCIFFSFNKNQCESFALALGSIDLNTYSEKEKIKLIFNNAISTLSEEDQKLSMISDILPFLIRGIGIHHGGLLPIIKEVTEILFQENFLKVLFTTETFAMGINMPARTVVFISLEKFDGSQFRKLGSGEYIQMSGRAGRRGKDEIGISIIMIEKKNDNELIKDIVKGKANPLNSSFHLKYNMILNLHRVEDMDPSYIIKRSFYQLQKEKIIPELELKIQTLRIDKSQVNLERKSDIKKLKKIKESIDSLERKIGLVISRPENILCYLCPGRLLQVQTKEANWGWGIVLNFAKKKLNIMSSNNQSYKNEGFIVEVLLYLENNEVQKATPGSLLKDNGKLQLLPVFLENIINVSPIQLNIDKDSRNIENIQRINQTYKEIMKRFNFEIPFLDPITDMKIKDNSINKYIIEKKNLWEEYHKIPTISEEQIKEYDRYMSLKNEIKMNEESVTEAKSLGLSEELKCMQTVLKRMNYCDENNVLTKGKVACEINTANEIVVTELIFNGGFQSFSPEIIVAILSCLVFTDHSSLSNTPKDTMFSNLYEIIQTTALSIGKIMQESKIKISLEDFKNSFNYEMMEIAYEWANGKKFSEICSINPGIHEGTIVRILRRLDELLIELCTAMQIIGNQELFVKFEKASKKIKRDIVFAASLYL